MSISRFIESGCAPGTKMTHMTSVHLCSGLVSVNARPLWDVCPKCGYGSLKTALLSPLAMQNSNNFFVANSLVCKPITPNESVKELNPCMYSSELQESGYQSLETRLLSPLAMQNSNNSVIANSLVCKPGTPNKSVKELES